MVTTKTLRSDAVCFIPDTVPAAVCGTGSTNLNDEIAMNGHDALSRIVWVSLYKTLEKGPDDVSSHIQGLMTKS